jgi:hypothetical protein
MMTVNFNKVNEDFLDDVHVEDAVARLLELLHAALVAAFTRLVRTLAVANARKDPLAVHIKVRAVVLPAQFRDGYRTRPEPSLDLLFGDLCITPVKDRALACFICSQTVSEKVLRAGNYAL